MFFFPGKMKRARTHEGDKLRWYVGATVFGHCIFFFVSLAIIGFIPMIENLLFAAWIYSVYLTLREWLLILYMIALIFTMYENFKRERQQHQFREMNSYEALGWLCLFSYYVFIICYLLPVYIKFRAKGGLKGNAKSRKNADAEAAQRKREIIENS